jgi:lysophospholipase L1-like esterase
MGSIQRVAFGLLITVLGGLAVAVTLEFVLRTTRIGSPGGSQRELHELRLDRPWIYGLRPGARVTLPATGDVVYEINGDGFRDRSHPQEAPEGRFRILVLGASVTFGFGVDAESTFPRSLERALAARHGDRVEVMNLGVNGYNAFNQSELLADVGLRYQPDLVLVEFCGAGLLDPAVHFDAQTRLHFGLIPKAAFPNPNMYREPEALDGFWVACRKLRLCALLDDAFRPTSDQPRKPGEIIVALRPPGGLPPGPERSWLATHYGEMARSAHEIGADFAVVAFPYVSQIYRETPERLQEQVVWLGDRHGWQTLDLLPAFRQAAMQGSPKLMVDLYHPNAVGHRVAAEATAEWLEREALIPQ